ncbi:hypothetical protein PHLCEN_2v2486 [Hermanssonia centrifuga]|uniref:Uncharacterized protein n=1 Tax=Hermanssonia centrifuga TaxID=98765 RepID=A0A2R6RLQ7_9APHY|nr:hypothetical protein PHLCEN_2v2486 [Hermanssonia centrifuga]
MPSSSSRPISRSVPTSRSNPTVVRTVPRVQQPPTPPRSSPVASTDGDEVEEDQLLEDEPEDDSVDNPKKRRFEALCTALNENPKKAKLCPQYSKAVHEARWIARSISPFLDVDRVIFDGQRLPVDPNGPIAEELQEMSPDEIKHLRKTYTALKDLVTTLREDEECWHGDCESLDLLITTLDGFSGKGRSDDLGQLKREVLGFIPKRNGVDSLALNDQNKSSRGWAHVTTARLLCPCNRLEEFDSNPQKFCRDVENGLIMIMADDLPCFLYPEDKYNPEDVEEGLLRGEYLRSVFRFIYTGPRTATKEAPGPSAGRPGKAKLYNMTRVTPESIAYAAVLGRFSICGQDEWALEDGSYKLEDLFKTIVELFDDPKDPWCIETLEWWNQWVFGSSRAPNIVSANATSVPTVKATLQQQRAARRAALELAANIANASEISSSNGNRNTRDVANTNPAHNFIQPEAAESSEEDD